MPCGLLLRSPGKEEVSQIQSGQDSGSKRMARRKTLETEGVRQKSQGGIFERLHNGRGALYCQYKYNQNF